MTFSSYITTKIQTLVTILTKNTILFTCGLLIVISWIFLLINPHNFAPKYFMRDETLLDQTGLYCTKNITDDN